MKILLINPEKLISPPLGLLYIGSALLGRGHEVKISEVPFGLDRESRFRFIKKEADSFRPDIAGITCMSMQAALSKEITEILKSFPKPPTVVVGGVHPTVDSRDVLSWGADIAVRGEGDNTVCDIIDALKNGKPLDQINGISFISGSKLVDNPDRELIKDLNELPPVSYRLLDADRFRKRSYSIRGFWLKCGCIITTRGCPGRCTFCTSKTMHGRKVREFKIERILDEVDRFVKDYDIEGLWIFDDTFTLREHRVKEFCRGLKERGIKLRWACQARVDTFSEEMARAMVSSGCVQVDFGVESGSQKVLDSIKKDIRLDETKRAFGIASRNGLRTLATVMVGLPGEDENDMKMTYELIHELKPNFVVASFATPYPGTELYDIANKRGWINAAKNINWQQMEEPTMVLDMPSAAIKEAYENLWGYNRSAVFDYLKQPSFLLDMAGIFIRHPGYLLRMAIKLVRGRKKDAVNLFLYMFRKEMMGA